MSNKRKRKGHLPPFVPLIRTTLASPAWKELSFGARSLYVVLRSYLRNDNLNNGKVFRSSRDACDDLGTRSTRSVQRWFRELEHYGFIVMTTGACLGVDGDGIAAHWRLTECASFDNKGTHIAPTRDFDRWDGVLFDDHLKTTESRVPKGLTPSPKGTHTDRPKRGQKHPKRVPKGLIDSAPSMSPKGNHNCLPLPTALKAQSTRRGKLFSHLCACLPSDPFAVSLSAASLFPLLKLEAAEKSRENFEQAAAKAERGRHFPAAAAGGPAVVRA